MKLLLVLILSIVPAYASAEAPDCSGPDRWPANEALAYMKNAGIVTNEQVDFNKTTSKKLSYEKIGKDLYRQVHLVTFERKGDRKLIQAIVWSDASSEECSMGNTQVFVISQTLGNAPQAPY
jgi:hypothetical protein